jgi:hypothetical protein
MTRLRETKLLGNEVTHEPFFAKESHAIASYRREKKLADVILRFIPHSSCDYYATGVPVFAQVNFGAYVVYNQFLFNF